MHTTQHPVHDATATGHMAEPTTDTAQRPRLTTTAGHTTETDTKRHEAKRKALTTSTARSGNLGETNVKQRGTERTQPRQNTTNNSKHERTNVAANTYI